MAVLTEDELFVVAIGTEVRRPTTQEAYTVLCWLVDHVYVVSDDRGAWTRYYRRH